MGSSATNRITRVTPPGDGLNRPTRRNSVRGFAIAADPEAIRQGKPPLGEYFNSLFTAFGPQHWWPGKTQFEVIVGAILTQNTSWRNVERAIENLRREGLLSPAAIEKSSSARLERLIHSSGYFRQKARKLKEFCKFLRIQYRGS